MNKGFPPVWLFLHSSIAIKPFDVVNITMLFFESSFHNSGTE